MPKGSQSGASQGSSQKRKIGSPKAKASSLTALVASPQEQKEVSKTPEQKKRNKEKNARKPWIISKP